MLDKPGQSCRLFGPFGSRFYPMLMFASTAIVAVILTFWTRWLALRLLGSRLRGTALPVVANGASFAFWAVLAGLVHTSNLEMVNPLAWLPYLPAQLLWLVLDLLALRKRRAT